MIQTFRSKAWRILQAAALLTGSFAIVSLDLIPGAFPTTLQRVAAGGMALGLVVVMIALGFLISTRFRGEKANRP